MTPRCVTDKRFRQACRDKLVELGQAPGLVVKASLEDENAVLVFPRLGHAPRSRKNLLALHWYEVDADLTFTRMSTSEIEEFLDGLE